MNHLEKMADEYEGELTVYKVDAEQEKELAILFKVEGYPVLFLIPKDGHKMMRRDGLPSEENLRTLIEEQLLDPTQQQ
jgi:thioredoxin-like negative regulator of GroEL